MKIHKSHIVVCLCPFYHLFTPWSSAGLYFKPIMLMMFSSTMVRTHVTLLSPVRTKVHNHPPWEKMFSNLLLLLSGSWHFCFRQVQRWLFHFLRLRKLQVQILDAGDKTVIRELPGEGCRLLSAFTQLLTRSYRISLVNRSLHMCFLLLLCISSWEVYANYVSALCKWYSLKALPNKSKFKVMFF